MAALDGRVAVISGAAAGIGKAMARSFALAGADLVLADISRDRLEQTAEEVALMGRRAITFAIDASVDASVCRMIEGARDHFGRIDVLCNNVGILDRFLTVHETTDEMWNRVLAVNLTGPFFASRAVIPIMLKQGMGAIINVASISSILGGRAGAAYTTSKHGIVGLTRATAAAYGERGVRCNAISPGGVKTDIISANGEPSPEGWKLRSKGLATRPALGAPEDIASVAVFLASDESRFINGANLVVDAGWTIA